MAILAGLIESQLTASADLVGIVGSAALAVGGVFVVAFVGNLFFAPVDLARESKERRVTAENQRDEAERRLANRSSREQLADHLDEFGREIELLRLEMPGSSNDTGQWWYVYNDFTARIQTQLRRHAPEWLGYFKETPDELLENPENPDHAAALLDLSAQQVATISAGLRAGTPPPTDTSQQGLFPSSPQAADTEEPPHE